MTIYVVSSGQTSSGLTLFASDQLQVQSGGTASSTTVSNGGLEVVSGGNAVGNVVSGGGTVQVLAGGSAGTLLQGGTQYVLGGGTALGTNALYGTQYVSAGGVAKGTLLGGNDFVIGSEVVLDGGVASGTTVNGGIQTVSSGGLAVGTAIQQTPFNGARGLFVFTGGSATGAVSNGGNIAVAAGGFVSGTTLNTYGIFFMGGIGRDTVVHGQWTEIVSGGGTAFGTVLAPVSTTDRPQQIVSSGSIASGTMVSGKAQITVSAGGTAIGASLSATDVGSPGNNGPIGDFGTGNGGLLVSSGGTASATNVMSGGLLEVASGGKGQGNIVHGGGSSYVDPGATTSGDIVIGNDIVASALEVVSYGGIVSGTTVSNTGRLVVSYGGLAVGTIVRGTDIGIPGSNGGLFVSEGGVASGTKVNAGGRATITRGSDYGATVSGGDALMTLSANSTATGTRVGNGGTVSALAGNTASAAAINGGTLDVAYGGSLGTAPVTFAGTNTPGGTLGLGGPVPLGNTLNGFVAGDEIDLLNIAFDPGWSAVLLAGNVLQIHENSQTYLLHFNAFQDFSGDQFLLASDNQTGTAVTVSGPSSVAAFAGNAGDFSTVVNGDGSVTVTDLRPGSPDGTQTYPAIATIEFLDAAIEVSGNVLTQYNSNGTARISTFNITGQAFTSSVSDYNARNLLVSTRFGGVTGQPYSSFEYDYDNGVFSGARYFYTNVMGQPYTAYEQDIDIAGRLSRIAFSGVTGQAYSAYEYDYEAGKLAGSKYFYGNVTGKPYTAYEVGLDVNGRLARYLFSGVTGQAYSAYEYDYAASVLTGSKYFYPNGGEIDYDSSGRLLRNDNGAGTVLLYQGGILRGREFYASGITGQPYSGMVHDVDTQGRDTRWHFTGVVGQDYSSYQYDYVAGIFTGYRYFYTNVPGQPYTGYEIDLDPTAQHVTRYIFNGVIGQAYSSYEYDYTNGVLTGSNYFTANIPGQTYTGLEQDLDPQGHLVGLGYSGITGQPYTADRFDYANGDGVLTGSSYFYTNIRNKSYSSYRIDNDAQGTTRLQTYDLNDGTHRLIGSQDNNVIKSVYNDFTTGGANNVTFVYTPNFGNATVTDFAQHLSGPGHDNFVLPQSEFADFAALLNQTQNVGGNAVAAATNGVDHLTLNGVTKETLATLGANFSFA